MITRTPEQVAEIRERSDAARAQFNADKAAARAAVSNIEGWREQDKEYDRLFVIAEDKYLAAIEG